MHEFSLVTNDVKKEVYFFDPRRNSTRTDVCLTCQSCKSDALNSLPLFCQLGCTVTSPLEVRCIEHIAMAEHNPEKIIKAIDATDNEPKNTALLRNIEAKTGDRRHLEQATSTP